MKVDDLLAFYLPLVLRTVAVAAIAAAAVYLFRTRFTSRRLRICMRLTSAFLAVIVILWSLLLAFVVACTSRPRIFPSPDGKHVAYYSYDPGFLGRDLSTVDVRKKWSIGRPQPAYEYAGPSDWASTEVRWLSNDHLSIRYHSDQSRFQECRTEAAGIKVQCIPVAEWSIAESRTCCKQGLSQVILVGVRACATVTIRGSIFLACYNQKLSS